MNIAANRQVRHRLPGKEDMQRTTDLIAHLRETFDGEELRFAFRELAREFLDPNEEAELAVCDNDGVVLGYFVPAKVRFRDASAEDRLTDHKSEREFIGESELARDVVDRIVNQPS